MLGQVLKPRLTPRRVLDALRDPHYRTGYALVANTIGTTAVGFFYWVVAAHLYDRQALGRCSALVSALIVVSSLAQLDLPTILPRFLPQAGRSAGRFIAYGYGASSVAALAVGVAFVTVLPRLSPQWQFLRASPALAAGFVVALLIWGIFALEDAALTGLHRAVVVPVENSAYGVVKLVLLVGVASMLPSTGVFVAWLIPLLAIVPVVNWLIFRRYARVGATAAASTLRAREVVRFALIDYAGTLFAQGYGYVLPLVVLSVLGATANGTFFVAYTIATALELTSLNFGTSLLVEGVRAPHRLSQLTRGVLIRCGLITISGTAVLVVGGRLVLRIYGSAYAANASELLALLGAATIPYSLVIVTFALDRIAGRVGRVAITQLALAVLVLGLSVPLMRKVGINGVGLALLGASFIVAMVRFPTIAHALRQPSVPAPLPWPQQEPGFGGLAAESDRTIILSPLAWGAARYQVAMDNKRLPQPEDDMTVIFAPMTWPTAPNPVVMGGIPQRPEDDRTVIFAPMAWPAARDQVVVGNIPQQPPGFLPRPRLMAQLNRADQGLSVLTGIPGAGKTQVAGAYARTKLEAGWRLVAWVDAQDAGSLQAGLAAMADAAGLPDGGSGRDTTGAGQSVRHWLEDDGHRCLLVFNDARDLDALRPLIPVRGAARVLIVSTRQSGADPGICIPVDVFSADEAVALLDGRTGLADEQGAAAVAADLGYVPLALAQAEAVILGQRRGYRRYLEQLRAMSAEEYLIGEERQPCPRGVAEAVLLSLEAIRTADPSGMCTRVMEIMAVLPGGGVRREVLHAAGQAGVLAKRRHLSRMDAEMVDQALARLVERSLLTVSVDGQAVIAHRLVMQMVRDGLARRGHLAAVCRAAASVLDTRAASLAGSHDRVAVRDIVEQVSTLRENAAGSAAAADDELARALLSLQFWALYDLNELGDSAPQAIAVGKPLVADSERVLGPDHPDTLTAQNNLAVAFQGVGRPAEAIPLFERALAAQERLLGPDYPDTVTTRNNLAVAYRDAGRPAEAIPLIERALAAQEQLLGPDYPDTVTTRNNLAVAYQEAGRLAEAIPLFERTLAALERLLGADHPDTVTTRDNLRRLYREAAQVK
ncbi:MAG: tetratricopeptide repeat protein [Streptosporangiaceae bacterium]|nr:tetratricopeptide repeat protein [Streptosporangiaceae bacterium]